MKVIISAGGTGGHIYPALAIIKKIQEKEPNSEFLYIGTHNRMEKEIIPKYNIPYEELEIYGFNKKIWKNIEVLRCLHKANKRCRELIKSFDPDIVIGVGGYVTVPVVKTASKLGYKTFIHEQNSVFGKANQYLSMYADRIGISFKSMKIPTDRKIIITGNPCSEEAMGVTPYAKSVFDLHDNKKLVLFVMGSLGASNVNTFLTKTMGLFNGKDYEVLYVTGNRDFDKINSNKFPDNVKVVPYVEQLPRIMKKTDLMVSRAGASTLSEIIALQVPAILIPSPYVTNNHQYKNAMNLVNQKAAVLIEEENLKGDILVRKIDEIFKSTNTLIDMKKNLASEAIPNSATLIYDCLVDLIDRK